MNNISFITYTNFGYLHFTQNLILSLEKINFPLTLKVYCIDQNSYDSLQKWNKNIILEMLNDETNTNQNIVGWKENGWNTMVFSKLKCIYKELFKNEYVFFTDSDIVFEKDPLEYLLENIKDYDMLIQQNVEKCKYPLNPGFMFIKSNDTIKDLFNTNQLNLSRFTCDQDYINEQSCNFKFLGLPRDLFPVEYYYYLNYQNYSDKFYIFHFNFKKGNDKKERIINMNKWYLEN
uniref:Nucleotide-diphospho-sugar transferase domain-containing protein n=1 Tax=viral metagenome TaxID=1070528 RepID=A0A6C0BUM5_9ZZZZ